MNFSKRFNFLSAEQNVFACPNTNFCKTHSFDRFFFYRYRLGSFPTFICFSKLQSLETIKQKQKITLYSDYKHKVKCSKRYITT